VDQTACPAYRSKIENDEAARPADRANSVAASGDRHTAAGLIVGCSCRPDNFERAAREDERRRTGNDIGRRATSTGKIQGELAPGDGRGTGIAARPGQR